MTISENEIICLLGNNGAGKSTLINMLVGLIKPTNGDATIYGSSICEDIFEVRKNIRLCQQFDFLFQELSPNEHLQLICNLRDIQSNLITYEI